VTALIVAFAGFTSTVGADSRWLAALGRSIVERGGVPRGVPYASAPSAHWHNVPALGELAFYGLDASLGYRGLMLAQLVAVALAFGLIAREATAPTGHTVGAMLLAAVGTLSSIEVIRAQLFSLVLFPVLVVLLRRETVSPSRLIWVIPGLLAIWANLHGVALLGLAVALAYLLVDRIRVEPRRAALVALASTVAVCLTPALLGSITYYRGVLDNVAAQRGVGLWAPLSPTKPLDVITIVSVIGLAGLVVWKSWRPKPWVFVAVGGLTLATIDSSRSGVWLIMFLLLLAVRTEAEVRPPRPLGEPWLLDAVSCLVLIGLACFTVIRGPATPGASHRVLAEALRIAHGSPILAEDTIGEQVALAGGRIWVGNPIDAFSRRDQAAYVDWEQGKAGGRAALAATRVAIVFLSSASRQLVAASPDFHSVAVDDHVELFERNP
jgi:hypothetical protein